MVSKIHREINIDTYFNIVSLIMMSFDVYLSSKKSHIRHSKIKRDRLQTDGRTDGRTEGWTDGGTDGRTIPLTERRSRIEKTDKALLTHDV